jgi:protein transport protein SEC23
VQNWLFVFLVSQRFSWLSPCLQAPNVAETEIGQGGTNAWSMGGIDPTTTIAVYFEVTNPANNALPPTKRRFIQVRT